VFTIIDLYRSGKFIQSLNPLPAGDKRRIRHVLDGWLQAGYTAKFRTATPLPAVGPGAYSVPFNDLEGLRSLPGYRVPVAVGRD
jgi:hypothetical protein